MRTASIVRSLLVVSSLALVTGCATQQELDTARVESDNLREQLEKARDELARRKSRIEELERQIAQLRDLQSQGIDSDLLRDVREFGQRMREQELPKGVVLRETGEGLVFDVEGKVLFQTGSDEISAEGQAALRDLAGRIRSENRAIRVDGHTDTQPISRQGRFSSNLDLSAARAVAVAEFLISAGVPASLVSVAGYGEHQPKADNDTPAGMAQNRRTEILIKNGS